MQLTVVSPVQTQTAPTLAQVQAQANVALGGPQYILKLAQDVIAQHRRFATGRTDLVEAAVAAGKTREQARKASSMRLAQWARRKTSAI